MPAFKRTAKSPEKGIENKGMFDNKKTKFSKAYHTKKTTTKNGKNIVNQWQQMI
jgi:hypothetical protein